MIFLAAVTVGQLLALWLLFAALGRWIEGDWIFRWPLDLLADLGLWRRRT